MSRSLRPVGAACIGLLLIARLAAAQGPPEKTTVRVLPMPGPHWVYLLDPVSSFMITRITVIDADNLTFQGMLSGGYLSNFNISPDHKTLYLTDTYWSRGTRGRRTDVLSMFSSTTLQPVGEVVLPPKRLLANPKPYSVGITSDGRFALVSNLTPAASVTVVDLRAKKVLGRIEVPGCTQVLLSGPLKFTSICNDGSLMTVTFGDDGKTKSKNRAKPFFDLEHDPVFDQPVMIGTTVYFVSYHGVVYPVDLSGGTARPEASWSLLDAQDRLARWRPGGWSLEGVDPGRGRLFVLMHQGDKWSHEQAGTEVWVFDLGRKKRIARIVLPRPADSIQVSQDDHPLLFAISHDDGTLQVFDARHYTYRGMMDHLGAPWLIFSLSPAGNAGRG